MRRVGRGFPDAPTAPRCLWGATSSGQSPHRSPRPDGQVSLRSLAPPLPRKALRAFPGPLIARQTTHDSLLLMGLRPPAAYFRVAESRQRPVGKGGFRFPPFPTPIPLETIKHRGPRPPIGSTPPGPPIATPYDRGNISQRHHVPIPTHAGGEKSGDRTTGFPCSAQVVYRRRGWCSMGA